MYKGAISYVPEKEISNVNIMCPTNIFVCGLLLNDIIIHANISVFRMFGHLASGHKSCKCTVCIIPTTVENSGL